MLIFQGDREGVTKLGKEIDGRDGQDWPPWEPSRTCWRRVRGFQRGWGEGCIHWCHSHWAWGQGRVLAEQGFCRKGKVLSWECGATAAGRILSAFAGANSTLNVPKRWMVWGWGMSSPLGCDNLIAQILWDMQIPSVFYWLHTPPVKPYVLTGVLETPMLCFSDSLWQSGLGCCKTSLPGLLFPL